ncbi:hypothetical protein ACHAW5_006192 [Stephanodiscus triporus]|uniref:Uncharacterized protein n=1 Tax=Stephanodiscus triporus TaxID=2934178 RepID=A0ABD3QS27_9STRA
MIRSTRCRSISVAIFAQRKDEERAAKPDLNVDDAKKKNGNAAQARLRDAAARAYHSLVAYGSSMDLSEKNDGTFPSEARRSKFSDIGRNLWMNVRNNPELFSDVIHEDGAAGGGDFASFEDRKNKAVAGGYARAIAARLILLNYIDTRCGVGRPPRLHDASSAGRDSGQLPSLQELMFGLKLFSRSGRAILEHERKRARASYDLLSLAASCFDAVAVMADNGSREAAEGLKDSLDEAFDAIAMLPNAASLFGESHDGDGTAENDGIVAPWQTLVLKGLARAESFVDNHCNVFNTGKSQSASKFATYQRFLPSLARLCYKHGSHFLNMKMYENAGKALHIALKSTDSCLGDIRKELNNGEIRKWRGKQMLHNLEADLVVLSIEAFYLLSVSYQSDGAKDKAIMCLDRIQAYMEEQHARDHELHSQVITTLDSAHEGPINHFENDAKDIVNRAMTAREDARIRHSAEKATLAFSRIMIFHRTMPCPSHQEESLIDKLMKDLVELSLDFAVPVFGSAKHSLAAANIQLSSTSSKAKNNGEIFDLALRAIRLVHVRRATSKVSGAVGVNVSYADHYNLLLDKLNKTHNRRPFVMLDKLNAMLVVEHQVRERQFDARAIGQLDIEVLEIAKEFLETITTFTDKSSYPARANIDTTLFVTSAESLSNALFEEAKIHFARAVSMYHSLNAHHMCAQWSELLMSTIHLKHTSSPSLDDSDQLHVLLGQVMTVKAYSLSMSGSHASGMKAARDAWEKVKTVDSMVTLFHCSLRHEMKYQSCDTLLEFDNAMNEICSLSPETFVGDILAAFPRLSNSCVENEVGGGDMILLGVQERWMDTLLSSFSQRLKEKDVAEVPEFTLFDILRGYLKHFEHIITLKQNHGATARNFEALGRIVDGVLKLLVQRRDMKEEHKSGRRNKRKSVADNDAKNSGVSKVNAGFVFLWDDHATSRLVGDRSDCVWTAEQLWNIGNQLMALNVSLGLSGAFGSRGIAADVFAASHDFCLLSEEEEGRSLSKGFLDYDVKFDPTVLPSFASDAKDRATCDISSEFSGQCLLVSVATAVDYAADYMLRVGSGIATLENDVQVLLSRSLHRLAHAQDEMHLNCGDEQERFEVDKMIALLALRTLIGVGDDSLAFESLKNNGLFNALQGIHLKELSPLAKPNEGESQSLRNVTLMANLAEERKMYQTSRCLHCLCAQLMAQRGNFVLDIGGYEIALGDIQKRTIQMATSAKDVIDVYAEIDTVVERHQHVGKDRKDDSFYSMADLNWFAKDANNRAVEHDLLGDYETAAKLFATALNILPLCGKEMQQYAQPMNAAYQQVTSKMETFGHSLGSFWSLIQSDSH